MANHDLYNNNIEALHNNRANNHRHNKARAEDIIQLEAVYPNNPATATTANLLLAEAHHKTDTPVLPLNLGRHTRCRPNGHDP
jgi:hypothetical protein